MEMQPIQRQGNSNAAESPAEDVRVPVGSATSPSQSGGAPELSEQVVNGRYYRQLLRAAFEGDWKSANIFFQEDPDSKTAIITRRSETVLHIAALNAQYQFVKNLVKLLSWKDLEKVDCNGRTALHNAVLCGRIEMVQKLVQLNPRLTQLPDKEGRVPFHISSQEASTHKDIAWFLAKNTTDEEPGFPFTSPHAIESIIGLTYAGHHDIVLYLVGQNRNFLLMKGPKDTDYCILGVLARMESHFLSGIRLNVWELLSYRCIPVVVTCNTQTSMGRALQCLATSLWNAIEIVVPAIKGIHDVKLRHVAAMELAKQVCIEISSRDTIEIINFFQDRELLGQAAIRGIYELVKLCIQFFPELRISTYGSMLMILAVQYRHERILRLFLKVSSFNQLSLVPPPTLEESWRMMLAAAKYDPDSNTVTKVSGPAFQMQRELQWFKVVESWVNPNLRIAKHENKTFWQIFVKEHEKLLEAGEKWAKDTASSWMLVSTLIVTVLFTAAFTVPGSNNGNTGVPLLLGKDSFLIFAISDGLGLLSSVMAILTFLEILTSQYEPLDFLHYLPRKIIAGLLFLYLSLAFMLVAFAATLTIVLDKRLQWAFIPITLLTSLPVALFIELRLPQLLQIVKSTFGPDSLGSDFRGNLEVKPNYWARLRDWRIHSR